MNEEHDRRGLSLGSLALGAIAGAIAGILLAPRPGKETRADLNDTLHKIKDEVADKLAQAGEVTREAYHNIVKEVTKGYKEAQHLTEDEAQEVEQDLGQGYDELAKISEEDKTD